MTTLSKNEIERTIKHIRELTERVKDDPELAQWLIDGIEDRPLVKPPILSPKERSDRIMRGLPAYEE